MGLAMMEMWFQCRFRFCLVGRFKLAKLLFFLRMKRQSPAVNSTLIAEGTQALDPSTTISFSRKKNPTSEILDSQHSTRNDLLGLISKVGVTLLSSRSLEETLNQVATLVFEAVPADRCVIMLKDDSKTGEMKIAVARERGKEGQPEEVRISRTVMERSNSKWKVSFNL